MHNVHTPCGNQRSPLGSGPIYGPPCCHVRLQLHTTITTATEVLRPSPTWLPPIQPTLILSSSLSSGPSGLVVDQRGGVCNGRPGRPARARALVTGPRITLPWRVSIATAPATWPCDSSVRGGMGLCCRTETSLRGCRAARSTLSLRPFQCPRLAAVRTVLSPLPSGTTCARAARRRSAARRWFWTMRSLLSSRRPSIMRTAC